MKVIAASSFEQSHGEALDFLGQSFGVLRQAGEADDLYRRRLQLNQGLILGYTRSSYEQAIEVEAQRANDLALAVERWKETAARQEKLHAEALEKVDNWRRRSCELEARIDDLVEQLCDVKAKLEDATAGGK